MPDMVESLQTFYEGQCAGLQAEVARLTDALAASRAEASALRAALEFYADRSHWVTTGSFSGSWHDGGLTPVYDDTRDPTHRGDWNPDRGRKARAALAAWRDGRE